MKAEEILEGLENLFVELQIEVRYDKGEFVGGFYRYKEKEQLLVNKKLSIEQKINVLARELHEKFDLNSVFVMPALREVIDNAGRVA